jgi:LysR family transcriptional regulator, low CO2-responsive transcriptional regulator
MTNSATQRLLRATPQQLRAFETAARLLSITRAAEEMHLTQPTVSVQLRELATTIGEPLFETVGRRIRLTQTGEALAQTVAELMACWQRFDARVAEINGLVRGRLRIAAVTTAEYFVPDLIGPFAAAHPGVEIELAVENRDRVVERLARTADELAVMMLPPDNVPLAHLPFMENPLVVIAPTRHALAGRARIRLDQLKGERWLMRESGSGTRMATQAHFVRAKFSPVIAMSLGSNEAVKHAVAAGLGIAVISALALGRHGSNAYLPGVVTLPVQGFPLRRHWSVVWRTDTPLSATARRFTEYMQKAGAQFSARAAGQRVDLIKALNAKTRRTQNKP